VRGGKWLHGVIVVRVRFRQTGRRIARVI
jgi:hypothetical protein